MRFLIDGYNLIHAIGLLCGRTHPGGLEKARARLIRLLSDSFGEKGDEATVVFDAANAPRVATGVQLDHGVEVHFAQGQEADDLIEELIRRDATPRKLTVVSDDHRIQQAARRRRCLVMGCQEFLNEVDRRRQKRPPSPGLPSAKPDGTSPAETQHWLREFADLADDPALREISDPPEFFEPPE